MGQPSINEIESSLKDWQFLQQLPQEVAGYKLRQGTGIEGQILNIASYVHEESHCQLDLTYTGETFDYVPVKKVGLHVFRDDRFFCRDREKFAALILQQLPRIIGDIDRNQKHGMSYEAESQNFAQWEAWKALPEKIGGFERFITPDNPLTYINGSIIFLDYTNFSNGNQLFFLYNTFRDELFAEMKKGYLPLTTESFNARNLADLTDLLTDKLEDTLNQLEN